MPTRGDAGDARRAAPLESRPRQVRAARPGRPQGRVASIEGDAASRRVGGHGRSSPAVGIRPIVRRGRFAPGRCRHAIGFTSPCREYDVCPLIELPPFNSRVTLVVARDREIAVFNANGEAGFVLSRIAARTTTGRSPKASSTPTSASSPCPRPTARSSTSARGAGADAARVPPRRVVPGRGRGRRHPGRSRLTEPPSCSCRVAYTARTTERR